MFDFCRLDRDYLASKKYCSDYGESGLRKITEVNAFEVAMSKVFSFCDEMGFSEQGLLRAINKSLVDCRESPDSERDLRVKTFEKNLEEVWVLREYKIIKTYYGATIKESDLPLRMGPFTIYDMPRHVGQIELDNLTTPQAHFPEGHESRTVIQYMATARDEVKALEIANAAFNSLDLLVAFLLGDKYNQCSIGVLRMRWAPYQRALISLSGGTWSQEEKNFNFMGSFEVTNLPSYYPGKVEADFYSLLAIVVSPSGELERKISRAVEWLGEAYTDANKSSAFLKAAVALEALLKLDEKSVITSSIMSTIAEQCAFINGKSVGECLQVEVEVKELYGVRSKIVHSGSKTISVKQLTEALELVRKTIINLVSIKVRLNLENIKGLQLHIRNSRYAYCHATH